MKDRVKAKVFIYDGCSTQKKAMNDKM